jgi:hypothetical protein
VLAPATVGAIRVPLFRFIARSTSWVALCSTHMNRLMFLQSSGPHKAYSVSVATFDADPGIAKTVQCPSESLSVTPCR